MNENKKTIMVIDDDEKLNALLKDYLCNFGFNVTTVTHPLRGLELIKKNPPSLVILDIMLPDMDGFETCRCIRQTTELPIIMLTARGDVTDRVVGLELGADDYMPKPFEPRELVARIQSVLRRGQGIAAVEKKRGIDTIDCGSLKIDQLKQHVLIDGQEVQLTTMEFNLLVLFAKHPGVVLLRERIMDDLSSMDWEHFDRSIDVLISRLRQKLGDNPKHPGYIKTVWGSGYKFIGNRE